MLIENAAANAWCERGAHSHRVPEQDRVLLRGKSHPWAAEEEPLGGACAHRVGFFFARGHRVRIFHRTVFLPAAVLLQKRRV